MAAKRKANRQMKKVGLIVRLWRNIKLIVVLSFVGLAIYGFWYSRQGPKIQRQTQEHLLVGLDWLVELKATNRDVDEILNWIIQQIPASLGAVIAVGSIEGADRYTFAGVPVGPRPVQVLENRGYLVGYDEAFQNPAWVAYRLEQNVAAEASERPDGFEIDGRTRARVNHHDYTNSGYDRGHMAPNYAIDRVFGEQAQKETFLMSNIVPQTPELNQGSWKEVEQIVANRYLRHYEEIWVVTGPIYGESIQNFSSGVAIPQAFFKIVVDVIDSTGIRALAMILPQDADPSSPLSSYLTTIDEVETVTGLDFLSLLDVVAEEALESDLPKRLW